MELRRTQMKLRNCVTACKRKKSLYRMDAQSLNVERALGKREVSLGESGSFLRGKSEFPLGKVKEAEIGRKTGILGRKR
jgi:hypothetical protein